LVKLFFRTASGANALGGAVTYEKPAVRDLGDIANHTYSTGGIDSGDDGFPGFSGDVCIKEQI
jgi:hypothetical protein